MMHLDIKAVENSKNTSGESGNNPAGGSGQLTRAQIDELTAIAADMGCTHFAHHLPMDTDAQMQANYEDYATNYNLSSVEDYTKAWCESIHNAGMKVLHRGTWSGVKGNNDFAFVTYGGGNFVELGAVSGAEAAGETTYCGKMWRYLATNVSASNIADGDIFAPISECTEFLANSNYYWFDTSGGVQSGMYAFFVAMHDVVDNFCSAQGKTVDYGTIINYSEYKSGYLDSTLPADTGFIMIDYYGHAGGFSNGDHVEPGHYVNDWVSARNQVGAYPLFQTEMGGIFGDSWPSLGRGGKNKRPIMNEEDSAHYQIQFWDAYRDELVGRTSAVGIMTGVNNWGFWSGQNSSILTYENGHYRLNYMGQIYRDYIKGNGRKRLPVLNSNSAITSWGGRSKYY